MINSRSPVLNFLEHNYPTEFGVPVLDKQRDFREPGSFWFKRV
jgi:hypothetical protein